MFMLRAAALLALVTAAGAAALSTDPRTLERGSVVVEMHTINLLLVGFISLLVFVVASYSLRNLLGQERLARFGALLSAAFLGLLVMVTAGTLPQFAVGWTVSGQAMASLIAHADDAAARRASHYVRAWFSFSDVLIWLAVLLEGRAASGGLLVLACIVRTGLVPAHRWLAQTAEAPSPVSAFLHAGIINAAGVAVVLWLPLMRPWLPLLLLSGGLTAVVGLWTMAARNDIKGSLASSTTTQMAFMSIEAAAGLPGLALLHLFGHGAYKSWSFLRAGGAITRRRLGHRVVPRSVPMLMLGLVSVTVTVVGTSWWLGEFELLSAVVGLLACVSVIRAAAGESARIIAGFVITSCLALALYLTLVHTWLRWLPIAHWQDSFAIAIALSSLAIAALAPQWLPNSLLQRMTWYLMAPRWLRVRYARDLAAVQPTDADQRERLHALVEEATRCITPALPLRTAVAVNPLQALTTLPFESAAHAAGSRGLSLYPSADQYLRLLESGDVALAQLEEAAGGSAAAARLIERTRAAAASMSSEADRLPSPGMETAHRWCQLAWSDAQVQESCFGLWHRALPRRLAQQVSADPVIALQQALATMAQPGAEGANIDGEAAQELRILSALLMEGPGWAAHAQWRGHQALVELLALRACLAALSGELPRLRSLPLLAGSEIWQRALDATFDAWLTPRIAVPEQEPADRRAAIGVVTCIDVRSEPLRRALEVSPHVQTFGMAGFFGVDACMTVNDTRLNLAPVILKPSSAVRVHPDARLLAALSDGIERVMGGIGGLATAEGYGLGALMASLLNTCWPPAATRLAAAKQPDPWLGSTGLEAQQWPLASQLQYARGFLSLLGSARLPALLVIAGHGADAANNAFAAAYQCGACGGNSGIVNARMMVAMLNNPAVREQLMSEGHDLQHTRFAAALHNTTAQSLLLDPATVPTSHRSLVSQLQDVAEAAHRTLSMATASLPGRASASRGLDWAQPFPEWGLVGNAACVIGPRQLTAHSDLEGRVFLHEYDWTQDPDGSLLRNILQGPGLVMHMINMQYFCSSVDPRGFGAKDKTRHNVVGDIGVQIGTSGDLHYGLPWQSLGTSPAGPLHVPVRLRVHVAAPEEVLAAALAGTVLEQLAANGWLSVTSVEVPASPPVLQEAR